MPYFLMLFAPLCDMKKLPHFQITRAPIRKNIKADPLGNNACTTCH